MANEEHLKILKSGVEFWNRWREENPLIIPNFTEANLRGSNFRSANLNGAIFRDSVISDSDFSFANLQGAHLSDVDLRGSNFNMADVQGATLHGSEISHANLVGAKLSKANLSRTYLNGTDLSFADLSFANLDFADLIGANFRGATLHGASFMNCTFGETLFNDNNLDKCIGLDSIEVSSPCSFDIMTLQTTSNLPKTFLQKMGFPTLLLDYLPNFYAPTLRLFPVYLAHSSANKEFARKLYESLLQKGVQVWFDEKKLKPGDEILESVSKGIDHYDKMILVCSRESLSESWWVNQEIDRLLKKERELFTTRGEKIHLLIPITLDDYVFQWKDAKGEDIRRYTIGDFKEWQNKNKFEQALISLIQALHIDKPYIKPPSFL